MQDQEWLLQDKFRGWGEGTADWGLQGWAGDPQGKEETCQTLAKGLGRRRGRKGGEAEGGRECRKGKREKKKGEREREGKGGREVERNRICRPLCSCGQESPVYTVETQYMLNRR